MADPTREDAWHLLCEWTHGDALRKHGLAVEACVAWYGEHKFGIEGQELETWRAAGLLHDFDYERQPDTHPTGGAEELRRRGYPEEILHAVAAHAERLGVPRESLLDKALYGCDELAGFITACAYVRPQGIVGMTPKSVKKKLKQPSFAAAVNRDEIKTGAEELGEESGLDFDGHVQVVIDAMAERADELGIGSREAAG
jgi:putative nucleotidyltransferase with HDIG domain